MTRLSMHGTQITLPQNTEILISRVLKATPDQVYRAHTEAALIQQWLLGPDGWKMPVCISDARPGGHFRYEWANEGRGFYATGEYIEATPNRRLAHIERMFLPERTPEMRVITEFTPEGHGTCMTMRMILPDLAARDATLASGMTDGIEICYARLDRQTADPAA